MEVGRALADIVAADDHTHREAGFERYGLISEVTGGRANCRQL